LQEELLNCRSKLVSWESERMTQVRCTYEAWQRETEDSNNKLKIAEQQRDEVNIIKYKYYFMVLIVIFIRLSIKQNHYNKK